MVVRISSESARNRSGRSGSHAGCSRCNDHDDGGVLVILRFWITFTVVFGMNHSVVLLNCSQLITLAGPARPRSGAEMRELSIIPDGAMLIDRKSVV